MDLIAFQKRFGTDEACRAHLELVLWPDGHVCTTCGCVGNAHRVRTRKGLWQCNAEGCRSQFTVTRGTIFHGSHLPLPKWFLAMYLIAASSNGISARKVGEWLGVPYSTAWFLCHRIRAMMVDGTPFFLDGIVEIDETFAGTGPRKPNRPRAAAPRNDGRRDDDQDGGNGALDPARVPVRARRYGRGTDRPMLLVAVERGGRVHVQPLATYGRDAIKAALDILRWGLEVWREKVGQGMAEPTPLRVYACGESSAGAGTVVPFATGSARHGSPKQELKGICATQHLVDAA